MNCTELKCARIKRNIRTSQMAKVIGKSDAAWNMRERGDTSISLKEVAPISRQLDLSEQEFADIFFDGELPFRKIE